MDTYHLHTNQQLGPCTSLGMIGGAHNELQVVKQCEVDLGLEEETLIV
jgi:hypothetical protein